MLRLNLGLGPAGLYCFGLLKGLVAR
ncbi:hypothetical protein F383_36273 [Gossypium arboreum]|uniref:Uncharacterized protein n=1 Tax=Gossypium arboreum TaxID=29729 RepID=A0A0B0NAP0_GOSAR|nr:hypothetical protein F383_36273 [Gossypium arboreum]